MEKAIDFWHLNLVVLIRVQNADANYTPKTPKIGKTVVEWAGEPYIGPSLVCGTTHVTVPVTSLSIPQSWQL